MTPRFGFASSIVLVLLFSIALLGFSPSPPSDRPAARVPLAAEPHAVLASAATFTVTTITDAPQLSSSGSCISTLPGGPCTLRAAVQAANFLTGGPHTINLGVAGRYMLEVRGAAGYGYGENAAATGDLDLNNVNVSVANTSGGAVVIWGALDRAFDVGPTAAAQLDLSNVGVQGGVYETGGGIRVGYASTLTLTHVTVGPNNADYAGGGIANYGTASLTDSEVRGNTVTIFDEFGEAYGGGIYNDPAGTLTLTNSTVSNNGAASASWKFCCGDGRGGGIANFGTATLENSTISSNWTQSDPYGPGGAGGGIYNLGTLALENSTVSANTACCNGGTVAPDGIAAFGGTVIAKNTIVANNCLGPITSQGDNVGSDGSCFATDPALNDHATIDPLLGPLGNYGGPTQTHSLLPGSPAIDMVLHNACPPPTTDQRGVARPAGHCDSGAFEGVEAPAPSSTPTATATSTATATITNTRTATPSVTNTPTATALPSATSTATTPPTSTATSTATATALPSATATSTPTPTSTPTQTSTATASLTRTATSTPTRTSTPLPPSDFSLNLPGSPAYAEALDSGELSPTSWTFEVWFRDDNPGYNHARRRILTKGDISSNNVPYFASIGSNVLTIGARSGGNASTVTVNLVSSGITPNAWHHLAATFNGTTRQLTIYIDGVLRAQGTLSFASPGNSLPLIVGRSGPSGDYWFGKLDDLRLWSVVRTGAEIAASFQTELNGPVPGLVGNWHFNEGSGPATIDSAGAPQNLMLQSGAGWSTDYPPALTGSASELLLAFDVP